MKGKNIMKNTTLDNRLKVLEYASNNNEPTPSVVLFVPKSGRLDDPIDNTPIVRLTGDKGIIYDRVGNEPEKAFIDRVTELEKEKLSSPMAVPCLFVDTKQTLSGR